MIVAAIILAVLVVGGAIVYILDNGGRRNSTEEENDQISGADNKEADADGECCGMHLTCEKDSLSTAVSSEIIYYDDEELDVYSGRSGEDYTDEEQEQFRDILLTLLPSDIAGWARSLQLRQIALPPTVRDELLLIVREARESAVK